VVGAAVVAVAAFFVGFIVRGPLDVNPVGFHAQGLVQINGSTALNTTSTCNNNGPCILSFDFSTDEGGNPPEVLSCSANSNCLSFSGPTMMVAGSPGGTQTQEVVNGRVMVVLQTRH
jgi:hypothetical protein